MNFGQEMVRVAESYIGKPAVYHPQFAGNCFKQPSERCYTNGLGLENFDCSGLMVRCIADVLGIPADLRPPLRHVREFWHAAQANTQGLTEVAPAVGSLLVRSRIYNIDGQELSVPGHIGIVAEIDDRGVPAIIHANAATGAVERRVIPGVGSPFSTLGAIAVTAQEFTLSRSAAA